MRKYYIYILSFLLIACSSIRQNRNEWQVLYLTSDSTIVQVKGLYTAKGKLLYNNKTASNVNQRDFKNAYLFSPSGEQIIALEQFILNHKINNTPLFEKDTLEILKKYQKYGRLYAGHICTNGDTIFAVNLIEKPDPINSYNAFSFIFAEPWVKVPNIELWFINLSKQKRVNSVGYFGSDCIFVKVKE